MFFRKAKRIKELEKELEFFKNVSKPQPFTIDTPKIEKYQVIDSVYPDVPRNLMETSVKRELAQKLYDVMKIEYAENERGDIKYIRASIRVVKEE